MVSLRPPSGGSRYYLYDGLGNTVAVTNSAGAVVNTYDYDPYGELRASTEAFTNVFRFGGAYGGFTDVSTGLVKIGHRFYDPLLGRWTQLDPMGGGYVYVGCNPVNSVDPSGLDPWDCVGVTLDLLGMAAVTLGPIGGAVVSFGLFSASTVIDTLQGDIIGAGLGFYAALTQPLAFIPGIGQAVAWTYGATALGYGAGACAELWGP